MSDLDGQIERLRSIARGAISEEHRARVLTELGTLVHAQKTGQTLMDFDGRTYEPKRDRIRLNAQSRRVFQAVFAASALGMWLTLAEIRERTRDPEASISARLRDLRKKRFGGYTVQKRLRGDPGNGLWEYRIQETGVLG